jgi:hypothetical protein
MSWIARLNRLFRFILDDRHYFIGMSVEDVPDKLEENVVYLIGDTSAPWAAAFVCPCGCKEVISLSLIPDDKPRWKARMQWNGSATLYPSVWRTRGCRSHFFVRRGRVLWVSDDAPHVGWRA